MNPEKKKITDLWKEKQIDGYQMQMLGESLFEITKTMNECVELLEQAGLTVYDRINRNEIERLVEQRMDLQEYIKWLETRMSEELDHVLYQGFVNGATEYISRIRLEDFQTENTIGVTQTVTQDYGHGAYGRVSREVEKSSLTFADFLGTGLDEYTGFGEEPSGNGCVREFADLFEAQYRAMEEAGIFEDSDIDSPQAYLEMLEIQGEFDHHMDKPC